jgi:lipoprotein-anchoring transpeptidase ErfK/SrfK
MGRRAALVAGWLLVAGAIGVAAVLVSRGNDTAQPPPAPTTAVRHKPAVERVSELAARVLPGKPVTLRASPGGRILARVGSRTEFGSPQTLEVAFRKGDWIAVRSPALGNRQLGWVREKPLRLVGRSVRLEVDLSARTLTVVKRGVVYRRDAVAIGSPETPTPTGNFYVTDKLPGPRFGTYYGCCILALSGRQPNLPKGWSGGDRLAIHGTPVADYGQAVTNGCLHLPDEVLQFLMMDVPLGTPVRIRA